MAEQPEASETREHHMLSGEAEYEQAINQVIGRAQRTLHIFDPSLARGGYSSIKRHEALRDFLMRGRANRLVIILHETEHLARNCPRLVNMLGTHSHVITILKTSEQARSANDPMVIADEAHYVHRFHRDGARFLLALHDHAGARQLEERFEQLQETARPAPGIHGLGL